MSSDPLLPIAPARVRALLLPLGKIKTQRFAEFVKLLQAENVVHLRDISADGRPNRSIPAPPLSCNLPTLFSSMMSCFHVWR